MNRKYKTEANGILELNNIVTEINSLQNLNSSRKMIDESGSVCEDRSGETIQSEQKRGKRLKNNLRDPQGSDGQN